ncbi:MAG: hypothetical protein U0175_17210 [Caldilineaceae bacterium]
MGKLQSWVQRLASWLAFLLLFSIGWHTYPLNNHIPAYGDALEVIWGIEWYHEALFVQHVSPFFTPLIFHPNGWQTATLAHTPLLFSLGAILLALGATPALSYNLLVIGSLLLAFSGARRFFRNYAGNIAATGAALVFTFIGLRWQRVDGHLHVLFATSILPWYLDSLYHALSRLENTGKRWQSIIVPGLWWGVMIHFSLYAIFWGPLGFLIGGWHWFSARRMRLLSGITAVALLLASPLIVLYLRASSIELPEKLPIINLLLGWSVSVDSLFIPSRNHPLVWMRDWANALHSGPFNESGAMNFGVMTSLLVLFALWQVVRQKRQMVGHLAWLALVSLVLSFGVLLRWNGRFFALPTLARADELLWSLGHALKPALFDSTTPPAFFDQGIPLPAYLLAIFVPLWDSARVLARYAFVASMGLFGLAAFGIDSLKRPLQWFLITLWLIESLPPSTGNVPLPPVTHPAYTWLRQQTLAPGEGIIDLTADPAQMVSGEILYATQFHHKATVSGVGSFVPRQLFFIQKTLFADPNALSKPETAQLLLGYGASYALFHVRQPQDWAAWDKIKANPAMRALDCYDPAPEVSPWPYPICIAEIFKPPLWPTVNVLLDDGWSGSESWGVWAEGMRSTMRWVATRAREKNLQIKAFPYCPASQPQTISIQIKGKIIADHQWQTCEEWQDSVTIAAENITVGWNQLQFTYGYAISPVDADGKATGDPRQLSVGFSQIEVK